MISEKLTASVGVTLSRFIREQQAAFPDASGNLSALLQSISIASKIINREVNRAGLVDISGGMNEENVQGEAQQKLDVVADIRFIKAMKNSSEVCAIISEEQEGLIYTDNDNGKYIVAIDPLDGSSNIDVNVSIGTIFSVYRRISPIGTRATIEDFMQGGRKQVAAGYVLYGSSTILVYTTGHGVNGFTYEQSLGEFILSHPSIKMPQKGIFYSINEAYIEQYDAEIHQYLKDCRKQNLSARYIGSLVADFHRNMLKGGIYLYPPTDKNKNGKLRLLYEAYPMALIAEQTGGLANNGVIEILDIEAKELHQRTPLYVGSTDMINDFLSLY